jgi:hypothetical protein
MNRRTVNGIFSAKVMNWRRFFTLNQISPLTVSYESLTDDTGGVLRSMVGSFGLEVSSADFGYTEERSTDARDPSVPPVSEIKAHFLNATQRVFQAPQAAIKTTGSAGLTEADAQRRKRDRATCSPMREQGERLA